MMRHEHSLTSCKINFWSFGMCRGLVSVYDICRLQTADRIDKENSINSDVIINDISSAK